MIIAKWVITRCQYKNEKTYLFWGYAQQETPCVVVKDRSVNHSTFCTSVLDTAVYVNVTIHQKTIHNTVEPGILMS